MRPRKRSIAAVIERLPAGSGNSRARCRLSEWGRAIGSRRSPAAGTGEVFYAVSGIGAVCHTVNPRLHTDQVAWILNHAEDALVFVDLAFLPQAEAALRESERPRCVVVMTDGAHMPGRARCPVCPGSLLRRASDPGRRSVRPCDDWPDLDENTAAALCYTSGTTGDPKGVLYSHRSQILHAFAVTLPDVAGLSEADSVLPAAPMFHVNAWGIPYAAALTGARLVLPGPRLHGAALAELIEGEGVTIALGVPTLWVGLTAIFAPAASG